MQHKCVYPFISDANLTTIIMPQTGEFEQIQLEHYTKSYQIESKNANDLEKNWINAISSIRLRKKGKIDDSTTVPLRTKRDRPKISLDIYAESNNDGAKSTHNLHKEETPKMSHESKLRRSMSFSNRVGETKKSDKAYQSTNSLARGKNAFIKTEPLVLQGLLYKKDEFFEDGSIPAKRQWKQRWVVLKENQITLYAHQSPNKRSTLLQQAKQKLRLLFGAQKVQPETLLEKSEIIKLNVLSRVAIAQDSRKKHAFRIMPDEHRSLLLRANTDADVKLWIDAIKTSIELN